MREMYKLFNLCCRLSYIIFCRVNKQSVARRGMEQFLEIGVVVRVVEIMGNAKWMIKSLA